MTPKPPPKAPSGLDAAALPDGTVLVSFPLDGPTSNPIDALTEAERAVAVLVLSGLDNAEVARLRGTSVRTVANLLARAFRKLGVTSRAELAALVHGTKSR